MTKYSQIAMIDILTPRSIEYYQKLRKMGVNDAIIRLSTSNYSSYFEIASIHTDLAKRSGMRVHASLATDLTNPFHDARYFFATYQRLGYSFGSKTMIQCLPDDRVRDPAKRLHELLGYISYFVNKDDIDIAVDKRYIDENKLKIADIPDYFNLTIINVNKLNSGIDRAGTWIYTDNFEGELQYLGYDYYGFYTKEGYQLSLDAEYVAQAGDTWVTIATRHGVWLPKLLDMNDAKYEDKVIPGQRIRLF